MSVRILFAAGGTGGHVYPALAVAQALRELRSDARVHFVGGRRGVEGRLVPAAGFSLTRLPATGLRGGGPLGALRFLAAFALAIVGAAMLVLRLRPDVVLATGGYASAAPAVAAAGLGRPLWLQEQNSVPGSTNRFLARFAERAYVAFSEAETALRRAGRVIHLPNPVRPSILKERGRRPQPEDLRRFDLDPSRPTLLVFGGSRGAHTLNQAFREAYEKICERTRWQCVVQTGHEDWERTRAASSTDGTGASRARVLPYIDDMEAAYRVADLVVCRAGAMTLAELSVLGKPSILVPYPHATDDHQTRNAQAFAAAGAAVVVDDSEWDGPRFLSLLEELDGARDRLSGMGEAAAGMTGDRDAALELAERLVARAEGGVAA
jgi:UDP-N-acetylglucosamine--N-acetylmuramyl-(pentapeptide) pyrophosphoryl-undecaprenol N-acetylglucosamine transferase